MRRWADSSCPPGKLRLAGDQKFTFHPNISFRGPQVLRVLTGEAP